MEPNAKAMPGYPVIPADEGKEVLLSLLIRNDAAIELVRSGHEEEAHRELEWTLASLPPYCDCACRKMKPSNFNILSSIASDHDKPAIRFTSNESTRRGSRFLTSVETIDNHNTSSAYSRVRTFDDMTLSRSPGNLFTIFTRAFSLSTSCIDSVSCQQYLLDHLKVVLLFNTGLTYHRLAIEKGVPRLFSASQHYYNLSITEIQRLALQLGYPVPTLNVVLMANYNNLGHLHSHHYDELGTYVYHR